MKIIDVPSFSNTSNISNISNISNTLNYKNNDEIKIIDLNHPWFLYPHAFMSEYNNYQLYKIESLRLLKFLEDFINKFDNEYFINSKMLMLIILGSTMEDALVNSYTNHLNIFQYQQLFPDFINNFIKNTEGHKFVQLLIISPDAIFDNTEYTPFFVNFSKYKFDKINKYEYIYIQDELVIKVNIFNCPMVSKEKRKNIIAKCDKILNECKKNNPELEINTYVQSEKDLALIKKVYCCIDKIFYYTNRELNNVLIDSHQTKKINVIVNSWVSFKNLYGYSENYNMFPELLNLASRHNIIATEWDYKDESISSMIKSTYHFGNLYFRYKKIIYVDIDTINSNYDLDLDTFNKKNSVKSFTKNKNYYMIDFIEPHLLKMIDYTD
jgi:hypothetical protein